MDAVAKLSEILTKAPRLLSVISAEDAAKHEAPGKWSKKQELGHLVDSACNNHQRVVRAQLETEPSLPDYEGDRWVALHDYQGMEWNEIIGRWRVLNEQLVGAASAISQQAAERKLTVGGGNPITLSFLVNDYVDHLLHHLRHIGIDVGARA
jgi:hypothetical protein